MFSNLGIWAGNLPGSVGSIAGSVVGTVLGGGSRTIASIGANATTNSS